MALVTTCRAPGIEVRVHARKCAKKLSVSYYSRGTKPLQSIIAHCRYIGERAIIIIYAKGNVKGRYGILRVFPRRFSYGKRCATISGVKKALEAE